MNTPALAPTLRRTALPAFRDRMSLGSKGLQVSPYALGMVMDPDLVPLAFDAGINLFFLSADLHWGFYEGLRKGLEMLLSRGGDVRDRIVVCAVSYMTQKDFWIGPFEEVLTFLPALERLDVLVAGGCYADDYPRRRDAYRELGEIGAFGARATGFSFHDRRVGLAAVNQDAPDLAFLRYNPLHPRAQEDVFPHLAPNRSTRLMGFKSTLGYVRPEYLTPFGLDRFWVPRPQDCYRYALTRTALDGLLCSPQTPEELEALARALEEGPLEPDEEAHLEALATLHLDGKIPAV